MLMIFDLSLQNYFCYFSDDISLCLLLLEVIVTDLLVSCKYYTISSSPILEIQMYPLLPHCVFKRVFSHTNLKSLVPQVPDAAV